MTYQPKYRIPPYFLKLIGEVSALRAWIENAAIKVSWLPTLQRECLARTAHSSTAIEGNPLSLFQVKAVDAGESVGPAIYEREVANYFKAVRWVQKHPRSAITEKAALRLHHALLQGLTSGGKAGKYKEKQNYVVNEKGIRIYSPPSPAATPKLMQELFAWLNSSGTDELHSVMVCAIFHHKLVSIHPFPDGNGRLARLLGMWILYQRGFDNLHIFSLDEYFAHDRNKYYLKIEQARELDDNLTPWIEYVAEGVLKTLEAVKSRIEKFQIGSNASIFLSARQEQVLRILRDQPALSTHKLLAELKITRARLNQIITPLIKTKLVKKEGQSRATRYLLI